MVHSEKLKAADEKKKTDEMNKKLEEALTQKQEAEAQNEQLKKKLLDYEAQVKSGVFKVILILIKINITILPRIMHI